MTDLATVAEPAPLSTTLDTGNEPGPAGGGAPRSLPAEEPTSLRDILTAEVKGEQPKEAEEAPKEEVKPDDAAAKAKEPAKEEKAETKPEPKPRADDGKFAAKPKEQPAESVEGEAKEDVKVGDYAKPPEKFLPDAKEKWLNTPRSVRRDIELMAKTYEEETTRYKESAERYESIRHFDEYVRQNGRAGIHETLQEVAQLEDLMEKNPLAALNQILLRSGPRKQDGQPVSLFELAQYVVQSGQDGYNRAVQMPAQQPQNQPNAEVEQLKQQLQQMQQQQLAATVIEPFKAAHPRYEELQGDIAFFLQSGKIPASLNPSDRLAAAYDMAVRINPASHDPAPAEQMDPASARRAGDDFSGSKSIKSAPGAVSADMEPERGGSIRDLLQSEMKRRARS